MLWHRRRGVTQHPPATPCRPKGCVELWASAALAILDDAKASPASVCLASAHNSTQRDCETPTWKQKVRSVRLLPPESMTHNEAGARVISGLPLMGCVCCAGSSVGPGHRHMA